MLGISILGFLNFFLLFLFLLFFFVDLIIVTIFVKEIYQKISNKILMVLFSIKVV